MSVLPPTPIMVARAMMILNTRLIVYVHFTQDMRQDSADRMERFIHTVEAL